jgi:hypothetical protein
MALTFSSGLARFLPKFAGFAALPVREGNYFGGTAAFGSIGNSTASGMSHWSLGGGGQMTK